MSGLEKILFKNKWTLTREEFIIIDYQNKVKYKGTLICIT